MAVIDARSLRKTSLKSLEGTTRAQVVLPFFDAHLDVHSLLVILEDGRCVLTPDLPQRVARKTLVYSFAPRLDQSLESVPVATIQPLFHFDPWWLLRDRDDIPQGVRDAVVATNIAEEVKTVYFDSALTHVVGPGVLLDLADRGSG